eukprot:scaffold268795_cov22-Tisochrysis_lutea.AAC.2
MGSRLSCPWEPAGVSWNLPMSYIEVCHAMTHTPRCVLRSQKIGLGVYPQSSNCCLPLLILLM